MDTVKVPTSVTNPSASLSASPQTEETWPVTAPEERQLTMPAQSLRRWRTREKRSPILHQEQWEIWLSRLFVFGGALLITIYGAWEMYAVVSVSRTTALQWMLLTLFTINFSWIAIAFSSAMVGFFSLLRRPLEPAIPEVLKERTAVVMPIYNETPSQVFAAVAAIRESVEATGLGSHFDYFIVSDTTNPDIWIAEERMFLALRRQLGAEARVYYRRRLKNTHRKAGNIADFVTRWGGSYAHMVVLDADSLMTGNAIVRLAAAMEADPDAGIIQTLPLIINRNTLFARIQQFAGRMYGPVIAKGLALWSGREGNYWGHNAIIRTKAFADHCGLPVLRGKPPFGGHILSHDFVEAALMRRAGWSVYMLPEITGSYEESPPSLIDVAARDRRWCQGNLQHSRVIGARGLKLITRQHFATGIMSYLASPLWLAQLIIGILLVLQTRYVRPEYFTSDFTLFPIWPRFDSERALALFALTMGILLAPKILGFILNVTDKETRRASGGSLLLFLSVVLEIFMSALLAPIMMVIQSGAVFQILVGRDTGWQPQRRDDGSIPFADIVQRHRWHVMLGITAGISAFMIAPSLFAWMSPTILGLVLAIPISWVSGQLAIGLALRRAKLLLTPEEKVRPAIAVRAQEIADHFSALKYDEADSLSVLHGNANVRAWHEYLLPHRSDYKRGEFDHSRIMAQAKLLEARSIAEVREWLTPSERAVLYTDRALLNLLAHLPQAADNEETVA